MICLFNGHLILASKKHTHFDDANGNAYHDHPFAEMSLHKRHKLKMEISKNFFKMIEWKLSKWLVITIRFFTAVYAFMIFQCVRSMKTFFTCTTSIAPFIAVNQSMLIVNRSCQECFVAIRTFIRTLTYRKAKNQWKKLNSNENSNLERVLLTSVTFPNVIVQIGSNSKFSIASFFCTLKWFDAWNLIWYVD